jgi:hypothetical protein
VEPRRTSPRSRKALAGAALGCVLGLLALAPGAGAAEERDLEPLPPVLAFPVPAWRDMDLGTDRAIRDLIRNHFADLSGVVLARERLVRRYGLLCIPALVEQDGANVTQTWNAALTLGALRDLNGSAPEFDGVPEALTRLLTADSNEMHLRAFAALALGCFHHGQGIPEPRHLAEPAGAPPPVPGPRAAALRMQAALDRALKALSDRLGDDNDIVRTAAVLALAKRGGDGARAALPSAALGLGYEPSRLLAWAFLEHPDPAPLYAGLDDSRTSMRAVGALAFSVALLQETPAAWTEPTPENRRRILQALGGPRILALDDGAEATFARGVCAERWQDAEEWKWLWRRVSLASTEDAVAEAACQALVHCQEEWFTDEALRTVRSAGKLKDPVLALLLLRLGSDGGEAGVEVCSKWLTSKSLRPAPDERFDPRWYAAAGLLRALRDGRIRAPAARAQALDALRRSLRIMSTDARARLELERVMQAHGARLEADASHLLPSAEADAYEAACRCPYALLVRDIVDACVFRVNEFVKVAFGVTNLPEGGATDMTRLQPQRYLRKYLDAHPYFSRLEFRERRGMRPYPRLDASGPEALDR